MRRDSDPALLRRAYEEIYLPAFPVSDEREALSEWEASLSVDDPGPPQPQRLILVACDGDRAPVGLIVGEHYRRSRCGLISYIAVSPAARGSGVGHRLMAEMLAALDASEQSPSGLRAALAEVHDPMLVRGPEPMDPVARLRFMHACGAKVIPVRYAQPALIEGAKRVRNLWLIAFPLRGELGTMIDNEPIRDFLAEMYEALEAPRAGRDEDLLRMNEDLRGPTSELLKLEFRREEPALDVHTYGVAVHVVLDRDPSSAALPPPSSHMDSFEQDMLAYAYRVTPPLRTTLIQLPPEKEKVEMVLPPALSYRAEGRQVVLFPQEGAPLTRELGVRVACTHFGRSGLGVLHVVFTPGSPLDDSPLNEYDLVKLTKVWEGGEGLPRPGERQGWLRFKAGDAKPVPFIDLVDELAGDRPFRRIGGSDTTFRVGTIQLLPGTALPADLLSDTRRLQDDPSAVAAGPKLKALGGIMQGLLDFVEVDESELSDVFSEFSGYGEHPLGFHKGTLLHAAPSDRGWESTCDFLGVSPYLLVPHGILVHNEERLREANRLAMKLAGPYQSGRKSSPGVVELRRTRAEIVDVLDQMVPNVMHYEQERWIYETGRQARGLIDLEDQVKEKLARSAISIDARVNNSLTLAAGLVGLLVAVLTAMTFLPSWLLPVLIVAVGAGFFAFFTVRARRSAAMEQPPTT